jgi:hypothetical protein
MDPHIGTLWQCSLDGMNPMRNKYYTRTGNATWGCLPDSETFSLEQMQTRGFEVGSTIERFPDTGTIMEWAKEILNISIALIRYPTM